jgi:nucleoside-diphosphate-sugar epimerase
LRKNGKLKIVGEGKNQVDITFVSNAVHAHLLALDALESGKACGKVYFIGQEKPVVLWEFINAIFEKLRLPKIEKRISFRKAYHWGWVSETFHRFFFRHRSPIMTRALAVALSKDHYFSHDRAREDLGYVPQISIEEGFNALVNFLRLHLNPPK